MAARVLYTDGGSQGNGSVDQRARMAVFDATLDAVVVDRELGALTNNEAEYLAIEAALEYAAEHALAGVELRSDSKLCVSQIRGEWKIKEPRMQALAERCRRRMQAVRGTIQWIPREQNRAGWHLEGKSGTPVVAAAASVGFCPRCGTALVERAQDHVRRPTCPRCAYVQYADPKVAVAAVLRLGHGILLCRRAIEPGLGKWSFPAGFVDRGEDLREALVREIGEETGLVPTLGSLIGAYSERGNPVVLIVYEGAAEGSPRPSVEASELRVFAPDELPELAFAHDAQIVADWLARRSATAPPAAPAARSRRM